MPLVKIWVYDGILASSVAGSVDVFTAANRIAAGRRTRSRNTPLQLQWRIESLDGRDVQSASGQTINGCWRRSG